MTEKKQLKKLNDTKKTICPTIIYLGAFILPIWLIFGIPAIIITIMGSKPTFDATNYGGCFALLILTILALKIILNDYKIEWTK